MSQKTFEILSELCPKDYFYILSQNTFKYGRSEMNVPDYQFCVPRHFTREQTQKVIDCEYAPYVDKFIENLKTKKQRDKVARKYWYHLHYYHLTQPIESNASCWNTIKPDLPISDSTLTDVFIVDEDRKKLTKYQMKKVKYVGHDSRSTYESESA